MGGEEEEQEQIKGVRWLILVKLEVEAPGTTTHHTRTTQPRVGEVYIHCGGGGAAAAFI